MKIKDSEKETHDQKKQNAHEAQNVKQIKLKILSREAEIIRSAVYQGQKQGDGGDHHQNYPS